jgi:hypothetical protein
MCWLLPASPCLMAGVGSASIPHRAVSPTCPHGGWPALHTGCTCSEHALTELVAPAVSCVPDACCTNVLLLAILMPPCSAPPASLAAAAAAAPISWGAACCCQACRPHSGSTAHACASTSGPSGLQCCPQARLSACCWGLLGRRSCIATCPGCVAVRGRLRLRGYRGPAACWCHCQSHLHVLRRRRPRFAGRMAWLLLSLPGSTSQAMLRLHMQDPKTLSGSAATSAGQQVLDRTLSTLWQPSQGLLCHSCAWGKGEEMAMRSYHQQGPGQKQPSPLWAVPVRSAEVHCCAGSSAMVSHGTAASPVRALYLMI